MSEDNFLIVRQVKHQELNGGTYPLASEIGIKIKGLLDHLKICPPKISLNLSELQENDVLVQGRIIALRKSGGISFIKIADSTGALQLIASKSVLDNYGQLRLLDLGDIVEVTGRACLSKTNEPSLLIIKWSVLTKSHHPPPEKYAGISNTETKYRQRYLDLMSSEESRAVFTVRSYTIRALRDFMERNNFMEVETSTLNTVNSGANALPFTTHHNALDTDLFLRVAPELYLKKLLVGGYDKVYEIGRNYRNEGISTRHNPEFTMLEFYEAYGKFQDLIDYTNRMFSYIELYMDLNLKNSFAYPFYKKWQSERTFNLASPKITPMWDAVIHAAAKAELIISPNIHPCIHGSANFSCQDLEILNQYNARLLKIDMKSLDNSLSKSRSSGEKIYVLFEHIVEPFLVEDYRETVDGKSYSCPVFIIQYPADVCPLARKNDKNPNLCDRFELFVDGRELCNAFQELNDPKEQFNKFKDQLESNHKDPMGYDADYIEALQYGMPPAIGWGCGIDRLVMLLTNQLSIKDVILFPTLKPDNR